MGLRAAVLRGFGAEEDENPLGAFFRGLGRVAHGIREEAGHVREEFFAPPPQYQSNFSEPDDEDLDDEDLDDEDDWDDDDYDDETGAWK